MELFEPHSWIRSSLYFQLQLDYDMADQRSSNVSSDDYPIIIEVSTENIKKLMRT